MKRWGLGSDFFHEEASGIHKRLKWQEMSRLGKRQKKEGKSASFIALYFGGLNTIHPRTFVLGHFRYGYSRLDCFVRCFSSHFPPEGGCSGTAPFGERKESSPQLRAPPRRDGKDFDGAVDSFAVTGMVAQYDRNTGSMNIRAVPSTVVNGKYLVKTEGIKSTEEYIALVKFLLQKKD
jgi:hypothetical protein